MSELKHLDIKNITDEKLKALGRTSKDIYYSIDDARNSFIADKEIRTVGIYPIRNKKTGRVVMARGTARTLKAQFDGDNYEVVESVAKGDEDETN